MAPSSGEVTLTRARMRIGSAAVKPSSDADVEDLRRGAGGVGERDRVAGLEHALRGVDELLDRRARRSARTCRRAARSRSRPAAGSSALPDGAKVPRRQRGAVVGVERVAGRGQGQRGAERVGGVHAAELAVEPGALRGVAGEVHRHGRRSRPARSESPGDGSSVRSSCWVAAARRAAGPRRSGRRRSRPVRARARPWRAGRRSGCEVVMWSILPASRRYRTMIVRVSVSGPLPSAPPVGSSVIATNV